MQDHCRQKMSSCIHHLMSTHPCTKFHLSWIHMIGVVTGQIADCPATGQVASCMHWMCKSAHMCATCEPFTQLLTHLEKLRHRRPACWGNAKALLETLQQPCWQRVWHNRSSPPSHCYTYVCLVCVTVIRLLPCCHVENNGCKAPDIGVNSARAKVSRYLFRSPAHHYIWDLGIKRQVSNAP